MPATLEGCMVVLDLAARIIEMLSGVGMSLPVPERLDETVSDQAGSPLDSLSRESLHAYAWGTSRKPCPGCPWVTLIADGDHGDQAATEEVRDVA
jgi:hypothetical protein